MILPVTTDESTRLAALDKLGILDTPVEARFDRLTRLAARTFQAPVAMISLLGENRLWFKSRCGLEVEATPRSIAFCSHAVAMRDMLVVENALSDPRFADNPLVVGEPHFRFYAGQPIYSEGQAVGTLCILDRVQRSFSDEERQCLSDLANLVEVELNHVKVATAQVQAEQALKALNAELELRICERTNELQIKVAALSREAAQRETVEASLRQSEESTRTIIATCYSAFIGTDQNGLIIEWNSSAERIFGWTRTQAIGERLAEFIVPPELRASYVRDMQRCLASGEGSATDRKVELRTLTSSGKLITVEMTASVYEWQGQQCVGTFISDVSGRIRTQLELEEKQELLDAVLESIDVAVVACDAEGNLTLFNRTARALHGLDMKAIAQTEWSRFYSLYHIDGRTPLLLDDIPLVRALRGETVRDQSMVIAPQGSFAHTLLASGRPLRNASGKPLGAVVVMNDITDLNASREQLAANERQLLAITENLPAMIGEVDADGKFVYLNSKALKVYGKTADELIGHEIERAYGPAEYARILPYIRRVLAGERVAFEEVAQIAGHTLHYQCYFVPQRLPNGQPSGFLAMSHDITARTLSEMRLAESEERLRTITDNVPVLIAYFDSERRYRFANAIHQAWLGKSSQHILGKTMAEAFGAEHYAHQAESLEQAWLGNPSHCEHELVRGKDTRIMHSTFLPEVHNGTVTGVYVLTTDATVSRLHERSLHALAHTDALTSLPNRRQFDAALNNAVSQPPQLNKSIALLYLDIDYFKNINDRHGHATGDAVLVEFARRLHAIVRGTDLVARLAGDEFTVLLNNISNQADVELVARKILNAIAEPFVLTNCVLQVNTTIGVALANGPQCLPHLLIKAADNALYLAKNAGRNTYAICKTDELDSNIPALPQG